MSNLDEHVPYLRGKAQITEEQIMRHNIYRDETFERLVKLADSIERIAAETHHSFDGVLEGVGIDDPYNMLIRSIEYWDSRLNSADLPSEEELVERLREDFQLRVREVTHSYVPVGARKVKRELLVQREKSPDINRVAMAVETLLKMDINGQKLDLKDIRASISKVPEKTWRSRPYWLITVNSLKIALLLNNQAGNRTFVFAYKNTPHRSQLARKTNGQLKEKAEAGEIIHHFKFDYPDQFKEALEIAVKKCAKQIEMTRPYGTYAEAKAAVQALGITNSKYYPQLYRQDPRLPSEPAKIYKDDWIDWGDFLRNSPLGYYDTYEEAKTAVQVLEIRSWGQYRKRYREDTRLPSDPVKIYGEDFISWADFLRNEQRQERPEFYETYEEAKAAAQAHGIRSMEEYRLRPKKDPRLPSNPNRKYKNDWLGWGDFLRNEGKIESKKLYETYEEAQSAVQFLKIKSSSEYKRRYKEDPQLPSAPNCKYQKQWKSWSDFLGIHNI